MTRSLATSALVLAGAMVMSSTVGARALDRAAAPPSPVDAASASLLARGGGGGFRGGGGGGGGFRGGGGGGGGFRGGARPQTGFQSAGSGLNRGSNRPAGGWASNVGQDRARPSLDRPAAARPGGGGRDLLPASGDRSGNRNLSGNLGGNLDANRNVNRNLSGNVNRNLNRNVNFNGNVGRDWGRNVNIGNVNLQPGWARPGWGVARPWNYGWYGGWASPSWGWWGAQAAVWGIGTLASAAIINEAVDSAVNSQTTYIVVPNTDYQLLYGTITPSGSTGVTFDVSAGGNTYQLSADCSAGTINGRDPASAAEAELLNAACQVAYGST